MHRTICIGILTLALTSGALAEFDYVAERKAAMEQVRNHKNEEALAAFKSMAGAGVTDFQKSDALEQAVLSLIRLKRYDQAAELASDIPLEPVSKLSQIRILNAQRQWADVVATFGNDDIDSWPDWIKSEAYSARGMAAYHSRNGELAASDLGKAVIYKTTANDKGEALNSLGDACNYLLKDYDKAMAAYVEVFEVSHIYKQCNAAAAISAILIQQGKFDEAVKIFDRLNEEEIASPHYRNLVILARGHAIEAAGKKDEAIAWYNAALTNETTPDTTKTECRKRLQELTAK